MLGWSGAEPRVADQYKEAGEREACDSAIDVADDDYTSRAASCLPTDPGVPLARPRFTPGSTSRRAPRSKED